MEENVREIMTGIQRSTSNPKVMWMAWMRSCLHHLTINEERWRIRHHPCVCTKGYAHGNKPNMGAHALG